MNRLVGLMLGLLLLIPAISQGAEISVTVQDASTAPIPELPVTIVGPNQMSRRMLTDSRGLAIFTELGAGRYEVSTHMRDAFGPPEEGEISLLDAGTAIEVQSQQRVSVTVTSTSDASTYCDYYWSHCSNWPGQGPAVLLGTLMRDGVPMRGALVCLERTAQKACVEVDALGGYGLYFDLGTYSLGVYEGEAGEPIFSVEKDFFEEKAYFDLVTLPNSSDAGMILAGIGDQVAPASCFGSALSVKPEGRRVDAQADPDGELRFYNLAPGDYEIRLECEGYPLGTYSPIRVRPRSAESYGLVLPKATDQ